MKDKLISYGIGIILITGMLVILFYAWLMFYPFKVAEFKEGSWQTIKQSYKQGEVFTYRIKYHKYYNIPSTVIRSFEDGMVYQLPVTQSNNPIGEADFINMSVEIPKQLPPGKYIMRMTIIYKLNAFRDEVHSVQTNQFTVTGSEC
jgi:hypothetical protein